jgi:hypothetical protein
MAARIDTLDDGHVTKVTVPGLRTAESLYLITPLQVPAK